jgi:hypothetical protein
VKKKKIKNLLNEIETQKIQRRKKNSFLEK